MRPPYCEICSALAETDGLLSFRMTPEDEEWERRSRTEGFVGHPPWQGWFCPEHREGAARLTNLTLSEALRRLR